MKKKIIVVFGTRPEAIKLGPVIKELQKSPAFETKVCVTGQHREILDQVLAVFDIQPDYDLNIMKQNQTLADITSLVLTSFTQVLQTEQPDLVLVHGDTTTTYAAALASFYLNIPVGHVEAGLRTYNIFSPFPEEFNRQSVSLLAKYHFAPTKQAAQNLAQEKLTSSEIFVTGNTAIDALNYTIQTDYQTELSALAEQYKIILFTAHRRENLGQPMREMFQALKKIVQDNPDCVAIYPMHPNPKVRTVALDILGNEERIKLIEPLSVIDFQNLLAKSYLVMTDSGGIQEEAPSLNKPVLVMRDTTERTEGITAGTLKLVGTKYDEIYRQGTELLTNLELYQQMAQAINPYGDGKASQKIRMILEEHLA